MFSLQLPFPPTSFSHVRINTLTPHPHVRSPPIATVSNATISVTQNGVVVTNTNILEANQAKEEPLPAGLRREMIPNHVAVIMDGNRRWAEMREISVGSGYEEGIRAFRKLVELSCKWGIRVLTVFAFSTENWLRPKTEVDFLMGLLEQGLKDELQSFVRQGIRISMIGDPSNLSEPLIKLIKNAEKATLNNSKLHLVIAFNYSGQYDITQACKKISQKVKDGQLEPEDINNYLFEQELETSCTDFPCPDLLIRTSGELRLSNFLLWQLAYTEMFFTRVYWPDFGEVEFVQALCSFQERRRSYGGRD